MRYGVGLRRSVRRGTCRAVSCTGRPSARQRAPVGMVRSGGRLRWGPGSIHVRVVMNWVGFGGSCNPQLQGLGVTLTVCVLCAPESYVAGSQCPWDAVKIFHRLSPILEQVTDCVGGCQSGCIPQAAHAIPQNRGRRSTCPHGGRGWDPFHCGRSASCTTLKHSPWGSLPLVAVRCRLHPVEGLGNRKVDGSVWSRGCDGVSMRRGRRAWLTRVQSR